MSWASDTFLVAMPTGSVSVEGYTYRGLGLSLDSVGDKEPRWSLTHLGSGHCICRIIGKVKEAFPIATQLAECGDWSFDGLYGWKNVDPEIVDRAASIIEANPRAYRTDKRDASEDIARQIATARAS